MEVRISRVYDALVTCYHSAGKPVFSDKIHRAIDQAMARFPEELKCLEGERFEGSNGLPRFSIIDKLSILATDRGILTASSKTPEGYHKHVLRAPESGYTFDEMRIGGIIFGIARTL